MKGEFLNLYVENGIVMYQTVKEIVKLDDEYDAHILGDAIMAGKLDHELTPKFIMELIKELDEKDNE